MSNTYYASAVRFQRRYRSGETAPTSAAYTAAVAAWYGLQAEPWHKVRTRKVAVLTPHETDSEGEPADREYYDAYELCAEHAGTQHRAYAGMTAYRIALPAAAVGLTLEALSVSVSCDPYNPYGARLALAASDAETPSALWSVAREGSAHSDGVAPRTVSVDGTKWYGATAAGTLTPAGGLVLGKYLWVYLSLENYQRSRNGWLEGSAILTPVFTLVLSSAISGYADGAEIGGGYGDEDGVAISVEGVIHDPAAGLQEACRTREIAFLSFTFGSSPRGSEPTPAAALAAVPGLFASLASSGLAAVALSERPLSAWSSHQLGLSCSIIRRIKGASAPFNQSLEIAVSPLAVTLGLPTEFTPSVLRLTNRASDREVSVLGVDMRLSAYWFASARVGLEDLAAIMALPDFAAGGAALAAGGKSGVLLGTADMPSSLAAGADMTISLGQITDRWGTLVLVPWIARVTADGLSAGQPVGLSGIEVRDEQIVGAGWVPDMTLEV